MTTVIVLSLILFVSWVIYRVIRGEF